MKTYDDFEMLYQPIKNQFDKSAANDGSWFETYGEQEFFVRNTDPKSVWTIVEGDEFLWVVAGFHIVNRFGYLITNKPWSSNLETYRFD